MAIESSVIGVAGLPDMDDAGELGMRAIALETLVNAGSAPRASNAKRAYRKRGASEASPDAETESGLAPAVNPDTTCLTVAQVCAELQFKETTVRSLIRSGELKSFTLAPGAEDRRVRKSDVAAFIAQRIAAGLDS
jgi:excisionase family DNA binding protein